MANNIWLGGDGTGTQQNDVNRANNWSLGAVPVNGDDVYILPRSTDYALSTSLSSLSGVTLNSLTIDKAFTANIGTATAYWQISASTAWINNSTDPQASGQSICNINFGSNATTCNIYGSASQAGTGQTTPIRILGSHSSNILNVVGGTVGVAVLAGESSNFPVMTVNGTGTTLYLGEAVSTVTTLNINGASVYSQDFISARAYTTINQYAGFTQFFGISTIGTFNLFGGSCDSRQTGTITTLNLWGSLDRTNAVAAMTVTNSNFYAGASLAKRAADPVFTNPINITKTQLGDITITNQPGESIQFS